MIEITISNVPKTNEAIDKELSTFLHEAFFISYPLLQLLHSLAEIHSSQFSNFEQLMYFLID